MTTANYIPDVNFRFPDGSLRRGTLVVVGDGSLSYAHVDDAAYALDREHAWLIRSDHRGQPVPQSPLQVVAAEDPAPVEPDPRTLYPEVVLAGPLLATAGNGALRCTLRRFILVRRHDPTEVSGTGIVAEGVEYAENKMCALFWRNSESGGIYLHIGVIREKHCHHGYTDLVWIDGDVQ